MLVDGNVVGAEGPEDEHRHRGAPFGELGDHHQCLVVRQVEVVEHDQHRTVTTPRGEMLGDGRSQAIGPG